MHLAPNRKKNLNAPKFTDDRRPRHARSKSGTVVFYHPCKICGNVWAGVNGRNVGKSHINNGLGEWYCSEHVPDEKK